MAFDWQTYDQNCLAKLTKEQVKLLKANIKPRLLQQPINICDIPPHEMVRLDFPHSF